MTESLHIVESQAEHLVGGSDAPDAAPPGRDFRSHSPYGAGKAVAFAALATYVLFQYNLWPGTLPDSAAFFNLIGTSECLATDFQWDGTTCVYNGHPVGLKVAFGLPQIWLVAAMRSIADLSLVDAFRLVWSALLIGALIGTRQFFGRFTPTAWIAWGAAAAYVLAPIASAQGGYGALQIGFVLVPTYLLIDLRFMGAVDKNARTAIAGGALVVATRSFALFTDGYSFIMALLPAALMYTAWGIRRFRRGGQRWLTLAGWLTAGLSVALAFALYTRFLGVTSFPPASTDFLRGQGVDLFPQIVPSRSLWFADTLGLHHNVESSQGYSDGPNLHHVFLGWALLTAALAGVTVIARREVRRDAPLIAVLAAGVVGFVLALGPSLKVADFRQARDVSFPPSYLEYRMPAEDATIPTGLAWIYQNVPAIETMRALYRWELLTRFSLIVLAVVALTFLVNRGRWILAAVIAALVVAESLPVATTTHRNGSRALTTVEQFQRDVVDPLEPHLRQDERVVVVNPAVGGSGTNHYLANWMCPMLRVRCYNVGGDKADSIVAGTRPQAVQAMLTSSADLAVNIDAVFVNDLADAVILVNFDLRANAYVWPASDVQRRQAEQAGMHLLDDSSWVVTSQRWTTVVRPGPESIP